MRKIYSIAIALFITASVWAQSPQKMSYQAVVRNSTNQLVTNQKVGMQITILQGSATGTEVYTETQTPTTNANGLVSIEIGGGTGFSSIDWSTGSYFIKTDIDPTGGSAYTITGASQFLSVPYALYAKTSGTPGPKGDTGPKGDQGIQGLAGVNGNDGKNGIDGKDGLNGKSAYELWKSISGNETKTEADFFASLIGLQGSKGDVGAQGIPGDSILTAPNGTRYKLQVANDGTISTVLATQTLPIIVTTTLSAITATTATGGGTITSDGGAAITARGVCWSTTANPTVLNNKTIDGSTIGSFASSLTGLLASTVYYVRAYATNSKGTAYGTQISVTTKTTGSIITVTDIDGNSYNTVTMGTQVWLAENLKVTKYNDGTVIPNVTDAAAWGVLTTGAQCSYNNILTYTATYGLLYNWYAVNTAKLCPAGWHVPSDAEWKALSTFLGGATTAGKALKETGTVHWNSSSYVVATNSSGFTALPGGNRYNDGNFANVRDMGFFLSSTDRPFTSSVYNMQLIFDEDYIGFNTVGKTDGLSVRCLKD